MMAQAFSGAFAADPWVLVFASGVSNSRATDAAQFQRERALLARALAAGKVTVYFGTCSVDDPELRETPYVRHKLEMEKLVAAGKENLILRVPQAVGRTSNPHTLTNFVHAHIVSGSPFQVWRNARRNFIDVAHVAAIATSLVREMGLRGTTVNVAAPESTAMPELVRTFEKVLGREARCEMLDAGGAYPIDARLACDTARSLGIHFDQGYLTRTLASYYRMPPAAQSS